MFHVTNSDLSYGGGQTFRATPVIHR